MHSSRVHVRSRPVNLRAEAGAECAQVRRRRGPLPRCGGDAREDRRQAGPAESLKAEKRTGLPQRQSEVVRPYLIVRARLVHSVAYGLLSPCGHWICFLCSKPNVGVREGALIAVDAEASDRATNSIRAQHFAGARGAWAISTLGLGRFVRPPLGPRSRARPGRHLPGQQRRRRGRCGRGRWRVRNRGCRVYPPRGHPGNERARGRRRHQLQHRPGGAKTITPATALPSITGVVTINGTTQRGMGVGARSSS